MACYIKLVKYFKNSTNMNQVVNKDTRNLTSVESGSIVQARKCKMGEVPGNMKEKSRKSLTLRDLRFALVVPAGIEPATPGFSVLCSTN
jgi:hypothetical protein